ncbi:MAG: hypothetical protein UW24_C0012G0005 [Parcubacteria group bacterium GW2011_GWA2_44_12]|nr:MAG: hypothetical protein UW24_C0012G0005 [Parcubacteria group bacterium GW2011_GWA2_44_12]
MAFCRVLQILSVAIHRTAFVPIQFWKDKIGFYQVSLQLQLGTRFARTERLQATTRSARAKINRFAIGSIIWCPREELNPYHKLRKLAFCPLNYEGAEPLQNACAHGIIMLWKESRKKNLYALTSF